MLCSSNPHHNAVGLSLCLAASESVKVRDVSESRGGLYSQEERADDAAQALYQLFLRSLLLCRAAPQGRLLFPQSLKMQEESTLKQMLLHFWYSIDVD